MDFFNKLQSTILNWWPWLNIWDDILFIQFFIIITILFIYTYNNIYYVLLYTFINFFLIGLYLAILQIELFSAFLWLVECSVLFVFLLLLFYLNIKGVYSYTFKQQNKLFYVFLFIPLIIWVNMFSQTESTYNNISLYSFIDNYYEALYNSICNDLFGFSISYYLINGVEFIFIGFLLLIGSVICVNLHQTTKNVRSQNYNNYLSIFNFFSDYSSFFFLRRQNLIKQGNTKPSLKVFKKK